MNRLRYAIMFRYKTYDDDVSEVSLPSEYATRPMHVQNGYVNNSNTEQSQPLMSGAVENGKRSLFVCISFVSTTAVCTQQETVKSVSMRTRSSSYVSVSVRMKYLTQQRLRQHRLSTPPCRHKPLPSMVTPVKMYLMCLN